MVCDTVLKPRQTRSERKEEVRKSLARIASGIATGQIKPVVGANGAIAFAGLTDEDRDGVTDACAYRMLMVTGSAFAKAAIAKAEQLAGRKVDRTVLTGGTHSHDGGHTWHPGHKK